MGAHIFLPILEGHGLRGAQKAVSDATLQAAEKAISLSILGGAALLALR
jgi:hypothetical protein